VSSHQHIRLRPQTRFPVPPAENPDLRLLRMYRAERYACRDEVLQAGAVTRSIEENSDKTRFTRGSTISLLLTRRHGPMLCRMYKARRCVCRMRLLETPGAFGKQAQGG